MVINATATGLQAFLSATQRIQVSATKIARANIDGSPADLIAPLIELKVAEQQILAAAKIIETEKKQVGILLDLLT